MELSITFALSLIFGCLIGLLPGLPMWAGPLFLLPFVDSLSVAQIIIFWVGCSVGSQFFGSVSAILLRIPGEASSLIYVDDVSKLPWSDRLEAIRQTAWGSFIASVTAIGVIFIIGLIDPGSILYIATFEVKLAIYLFMFVALIGFTNKKIETAFLFLLGVLLSEKTNATLPVELLVSQRWWDDITVFSLMLGLIIIPDWVENWGKNIDNSKEIYQYKKQPLEWKLMFKGSVIGGLCGLIPGAMSVVSTMITYKVTAGSTFKKVIAAESANNSTVITSMLPFIIFGIPFGLDQVGVDGLLKLKLTEMPAAMFEPTLFGNHIDLLLVSALGFSTFYLFLSQSFIKFYAAVVRLLHSKLWILYLAIVSGIIYIDIKFNAVSVLPYSIWLLAIAGIGSMLKKYTINPLPVILGFALGDQITWAITHIL